MQLTTKHGPFKFWFMGHWDKWNQLTHDLGKYGTEFIVKDAPKAIAESRKQIAECVEARCVIDPRETAIKINGKEYHEVGAEFGMTWKRESERQVLGLKHFTCAYREALTDAASTKLRAELGADLEAFYLEQLDTMRAAQLHAFDKKVGEYANGLEAIADALRSAL